MNDAQLDALVSRLEAQAAAHLHRYRIASGPGAADVPAHAARREARVGLAALALRAETERLDVDARWQVASWTEDLHGGALALPLFRVLHVDAPDHAPTAFAVGRLLLARGNETGRAFLEHAMRADPAAVIPGCALLQAHLANEGRLAEAERYRERAQASRMRVVVVS